MKPRAAPTSDLPAPHLANLLGAFITTVDDEMTTAISEEGGVGGMGSVAVVALDTWTVCSIDFLANVLGLSHSGAVRLVDRLTASGVANRGPGEDGRTAALRLTSAGSALAARLRTRRLEVLDRILEGATRHEQEVLADLLDRVLRGTSRSRSEARAICRICDHSVCNGQDCPIGSSVDE